MKGRPALMPGLAAAALFMLVPLCSAQFPQQLNYQVMLTDGSDQPLANQPVQLVFRLFEEEVGGLMFWAETQNVETSSIGVVSVALGSVNPIEFYTSGPMWLEVEVNGEIMTPRRRMTSAPYAWIALDALHAAEADHAANSDHLGDIIFEAYALDDDLWQPGTLNNPANPLEWTKLKNVPAGFADGTDDVGTGVSGSGTANYVAKFTGATSLGNSAIYEDGGRVAVGSPTYDAALSVEWAGASPAIYATNVSALESPSVVSIVRTEPMQLPEDGMLLLQFPDDSTYGSLIQCEKVAAGGGSVETVFLVSHTGQIQATDGLYLTAPTSSLHTLQARSDTANAGARAVSAVYEGTGAYDAVAVYGESNPQDNYGYGGQFIGGWIGAMGKVEPTGNHAYYGLYGTCSGGAGGNSNYGVYGYATGGASINYGVHGYAAGGAQNWAGYFNGNARVTGTFVNPGPVLEIDHPADPENAYLRHALVASSELKTVYDGTVLLDGAGEAVVTLPEWFEDLNADFRYQLTCIGAHAPVYIADEIEGNRFRIAGGEPGMKVSWQVTGVRVDASARHRPLVVEERKGPKDRGLFLTPEAYGASRESGIGHVAEKKAGSN